MRLTDVDVLLREESVTVAGEKMGLSAPVMSRTLLRARKMLGDPVFVRAGKRLVPTPKALELIPRVVFEMREIALLRYRFTR